MTGEVVQAHPDTSAEEVSRLLSAHRIGGLPVVDGDDKVVGVVSRTDLAGRRAARGRAGPGEAATAGHLMTSPAVTVHPEQRVADAARVMERRRVDRLPVVDEEDRLIGIATRRDLLRVFLRTDEEIRADVAAAVPARAPARDAGSPGVDVRDGVVTLTGRPRPGADASALVRAAWRVDGVVGVVNRLADAPGTGRLPESGASPRPRAG
ncbi:CBS domain-containing protein [Streptomyces sudanensis]|uniref:CBS domain-containing protein n=2 Tax=Streptomyces TaxID=1883 RepID=A0ABY4TPJ0_9ACTN|nr:MULTISPECIES: CBS domain-containing protein [Streptomyces]MCP9988989.1 CBS domain-containing protein [Streptomyces sudanensis]URN18910.1 CBS domain-containing protein [Streptomyces sudanensis]